MSNPTQTIVTEEAELMRSVIQRVATGPELSKNISYDEAKAVMHCILSGRADPIQAGVFLIGLRMKRETEDEVKGILDALIDETDTLNSDQEQVVVMAEPYNGFNRTLQGSLFVLPVLAACGIRAYSHGLELGGPKYGVTHHTILRALGGDPRRSLQQLSDRLSDPTIGWGYIDQSVFCPSLFGLTDLRTRIVKRPVLSTTEVLLAPLRGAEKTHLMTGYVHKPYRDVYSMLAKHVGFESLLLVRGTEGGVIPSFRGRAHIVRYSDADEHAGEQQELDIELAELDLDREYRAEDIPESMLEAQPHPERIGMKWDIDALSGLCAKSGRQALEGKAGAMQDAAVMGAAMALWHIGDTPDMKSAVAKARDAITSGRALEHLDAGL